jgi:transcriptional regulator with XRE-family HTH domain
MKIGQKIKSMRKLRGMTQKELGMAVGFSENTADVRIDQYEAEKRSPKDDVLKKISKALSIDFLSLATPAPESLAGVMYTLFELDEYGYNLQLVKTGYEDDINDTRPRTAISLGGSSINGFLEEWAIRKRELAEKKITIEEYTEWKLNFPLTSDDCGKIEPKIKWRE